MYFIEKVEKQLISFFQNKKSKITLEERVKNGYVSIGETLLSYTISLDVAGDLCSSCFQLSPCSGSSPWTAVHTSLGATHRTLRLIQCLFLKVIVIINQMQQCRRSQAIQALLLVCFCKLDLEGFNVGVIEKIN